jgi:hypothetical protein
MTSKGNATGLVIAKKATKAPASKPGEKLQVRMLEEKNVDYIRIFLGGPKGETPFEIVYHRPIGVTGLEDDDWVASTPGDISLLLGRVDDPHAKELQEKRTAFLKKSAVDGGKIKINDDGAMTYSNGKDRNSFLKPLREEAKKAAKALRAAHAIWLSQDSKTRSPVEPLKKSENTLLKEALANDESVEAKEELAFSAHMSSENEKEKAVQAHPSTYETMKGFYADHHQSALTWAKGFGPVELQQEVAKFMGLLSGFDLEKINPKIKALLGDGKPASKEG